MDRERNERHVALTAAGLRDISDEFADEMGRRPTSLELFEILTWGLRSCRDDALVDVHPANVIGLAPKVKGAVRVPRGTDDAESAVGELNDSAFVTANDFLSELTGAIRADTGQPPTLDALCAVLVEGLQRCDEHMLVGVSPAQIVGIRTETGKARKIVTKVGDVVAIPAKNGEYFIASVLAKNRFGTAYGLFDGTSRLKPVSASSHPRPKRHPMYSGDRLVASGRWKIIGHDEGLLSLFPAEPEIYHREQVIPGGAEIGPYGSGETAEGRLRHLTLEEAEEIGLLRGDYNQAYLEEDLEDHLNSTLR